MLATEGGAFISAMYIAEEEARARGLVGGALLAHRQARIRPVADYGLAAEQLTPAACKATLA